MRKQRIISNKERTNYHIMIRTAQGLYWMACEAFRDEVMAIIETFTKIYCVKIHASACLHNHYHLAITADRSEMDLDDIKTRYQLLQDQLVYKRPWRRWERKYCQKRFTSLRMFMWEINRRIAVAYNRRNGTTGHFWGARYKSKLVEDGDPMLRVMIWIGSLHQIHSRSRQLTS